MQVLRYRCFGLLVCRFIFRSNVLGRHPLQRIVLQVSHSLLRAFELAVLEHESGRYGASIIDILQVLEERLVSERCSMKASIGLD